jgi:hypothetical protein
MKRSIALLIGSQPAAPSSNVLLRHRADVHQQHVSRGDDDESNVSIGRIGRRFVCNRWRRIRARHADANSAGSKQHATTKRARHAVGHKFIQLWRSSVDDTGKRHVSIDMDKRLVLSVYHGTELQYLSGKLM